MYTCNSCSLQFPTPEDQRGHMKSDWHRYNLKRRVANLPAIDEDLFNEKVQKLTLEEANEESQSKNKKLSKKDQRRQEKEALLEKKKQLLEIARQNMLKSMAAENETKQDQAKEEVQQTEQKVDEIEKSTNDQELTEEQQAEKLMEEKVQNKVEIPKEVCLFCNKKFPYFEECLNHMFKKHGFFIPEQKFLVDKEGLVKYMAEKVGLGNLCFVCSFQGRSLEAARAHMLSKNHCKIPYESEDEKMEISEFYDFTSTYDDYKQVKEGDDDDNDEEWEDVEEVSGDEDNEEDDEELPQEVSYNDGIELHLPSGVKVGHRSLARYYRQNLRPEIILSEGQGTVISAESRHLATVHDRKQLLEKKRVWKNEKHHQDRDDRRAAKFINNQPHYRDQLLQ